MTTEETKRRLALLADFLLKVPSERFDYKRWLRAARPDYTGPMTLESCGTVGCALGWATQVPEFKAMGLTFTPGGNVMLGSGYFTNIDAACELFGLEPEEAEYLFAYENEFSELPDWSPAQVAAHIRGFIDNHCHIP